jgi:hypothetical protein
MAGPPKYRDTLPQYRPVYGLRQGWEYVLGSGDALRFLSFLYFFRKFNVLMLIQGSGFEVQGEKRLIKSEEQGATNSREHGAWSDYEHGARSREQRARSEQKLGAWSKEHGAK